MGKFINRLGMRFGLLKVIKRLPNDVYKQAVWMCKCKCGNTTSLTASNLASNNSKSCGCLRQELLQKRPYEYLYNKLVTSAKRRNRKCSITYSQFVKFTATSHCYYCGELISWDKHTTHRRYDGWPSQSYKIDRLNNDEDYSVRNCVVCCGECNQMKGKLSREEFFDKCKKISNFNNL